MLEGDSRMGTRYPRIYQSPAIVCTATDSPPMLVEDVTGIFGEIDGRIDNFQREKHGELGIRKGSTDGGLSIHGDDCSGSERHRDGDGGEFRNTGTVSSSR